MMRLHRDCVRIAACVAGSRVMKVFAKSAIRYVSILALVMGSSISLTKAAVAGPTPAPTATLTATPTAPGPQPPPAAPSPTPTATPSASGQTTPGVESEDAKSSFGNDPGRILKVLQSGKSADVIVEFEASAVRVEALRRATAKGLRSLGPDELSYKRDAYASVKQKGLEGLEGVTILGDFENLPTSFVRVSNEDALNSLLARPEVRTVFENRKLRLGLDESLPLIKHQNVVAQDLDGTGTVVAVFDTGVQYDNAYFDCTTPGEPGCRVLATRESTEEFCDDPPCPHPLQGWPDLNKDDEALDGDLYLHGTHVSTIVASVAGETKLVVADVCHPTYGCGDLYIRDAINWVLDLKNPLITTPPYNIVAMNLSIYDSDNRADHCDDPDIYPLVTEMGELLNAGIQPVIISGNDAHWGDPEAGFARDGVSWPACISGVVSVGAVYDSDVGRFHWHEEGPYGCVDEETEEDMVTCFSQTASYLSLLAPGAISTIDCPTSPAPPECTNGKLYDFGTSFAAPHVSGAWAVMREAWPNKTEAEILTILQDDGRVVTDTRLPQGDRDFKRLDFLPEPDQLLVLSSGIMALWGLSFLRVRNRGWGRRLG